MQLIDEDIWEYICEHSSKEEKLLSELRRETEIKTNKGRDKLHVACSCFSMLEPASFVAAPSGNERQLCLRGLALANPGLSPSIMHVW